MLSGSNGHCQDNGFYCKVGASNYPCLPHWKFNDAITSAEGTGPAPDGDEDAILGMILLVYGTELTKVEGARQHDPPPALPYLSFPHLSLPLSVSPLLFPLTFLPLGPRTIIAWLVLPLSAT